MKLCINSGCKHELDDYQQRCPYCGWSQKTINFDKKKEMEDKIETYDNEAWIPYRKRNIIVTIYMYFAIVGNILACLVDFFPKQAWGSNYPDSAIPLSILNGVLGIVNIIAFVMLLNWRKKGILLLAISGTAGMFLGMMTSNFPWSILGLLVCFLILRLERDGKSCWEQLS